MTSAITHHRRKRIGPWENYVCGVGAYIDVTPGQIAVIRLVDNQRLAQRLLKYVFLI